MSSHIGHAHLTPAEFPDRHTCIKDFQSCNMTSQRASVLHREEEKLNEERERLRSSNIRQKREFLRENKRVDALKRWKYPESRASMSTSNGRWLFSSKKSANSIKMLKQQLKYDRKVESRRRKVDSRRKKYRGPKYASYNVSWLFLRREAEIRAMQQINLAGNTRLLRRRQILSEQNNDTPGINSYIESGAWMFCKSTCAGSYRLLVSLLKHVEVFERKQGIRRLLECLYGGCSKTHCQFCEERSNDLEKQCLESLLLLFPVHD